MVKSIEMSLERYLLGRMSKLPVPDPFAMPCAPWLTLEPQIISQQECLDANAIPSDILACGVSCANKITECFVQFVRHPHVVEFTGSMQPCQCDRIAPIVLY